MKSNTNFFFEILNNEFRKLLQTVISFPPLINNERLFEAGIFCLVHKMVILEYNLKGWAFIRAWAFIIYLRYLIFIIMNINENLKNEVKC